MSVVDDVIAGTRCIEVADLGGVSLPVRALSELEREDTRLSAADALAVMLPGGAPTGDLLDARHRTFLLARAVLDPDALLDGIRRPLTTPSKLGKLASDKVDALVDAYLRVHARVFSAGGSRENVRAELSRLASSIRRAAMGQTDEPHRRTDLVLRLAHPSHASAPKFFGVDEHELTFDQLFFHAELHR